MLILLVILLLHFSAVITVHAGRDGVDIKMKYLGLTLYPRKKRKKSADDTESGEDPPAEKEFADDLTLEVSDDELMHGLSEKKEKSLTASAETASKEKSDKKDDTAKKSENKDSKSKKDKSAKDDSSEKSDRADESDDSESDGGEKKEKKSLREKIAGYRAKYEKLKPYIPTTWKYFKKLLKAVRIRIDNIWVAVGRDDAHEAAIFYGSIQAAICSLLTTLAGMFTVKVKRCDVDCRFAENVIDGCADISVRVRPSTIVAIIVCMGVKFLIIWFGNKRKAKKKKQNIGNDTAAQTA